VSLKRAIGYFFLSIPFIGVACLGLLPGIPWWDGLATLGGGCLLAFLLIKGMQWVIIKEEKKP
jgi:hypothetical protein